MHLAISSHLPGHCYDYPCQHHVGASGKCPSYREICPDCSCDMCLARAHGNPVRGYHLEQRHRRRFRSLPTGSLCRVPQPKELLHHGDVSGRTWWHPRRVVAVHLGGLLRSCAGVRQQRGTCSATPSAPATVGAYALFPLASHKEAMGGPHSSLQGLLPASSWRGLHIWP